jgi:hypothetical protein
VLLFAKFTGRSVGENRKLTPHNNHGIITIAQSTLLTETGQCTIIGIGMGFGFVELGSEVAVGPKGCSRSPGTIKV